MVVTNAFEIDALGAVTTTPTTAHANVSGRLVGDETDWVFEATDIYDWNAHMWYYLPVVAPGATVEVTLAVILDGPSTHNGYQGASFTIGGLIEAVQASNDAPFAVWGKDYYQN